jgi:hypothetical protein
LFIKRSIWLSIPEILSVLEVLSGLEILSTPVQVKRKLEQQQVVKPAGKALTGLTGLTQEAIS